MMSWSVLAEPEVVSCIAHPPNTDASQMSHSQSVEARLTITYNAAVESMESGDTER